MKTPRVLFVGCDKGAWQMRGKQLAAALPNAHATCKPSEHDWRTADVVVLVKRGYIWRQAAKAFGVPIVWDVLDFWHQPAENNRPVPELRDVVRLISEGHGISLLIGATRAMAADIGGTYLPHHCRLGLQPTRPRRECRVVAYDGSPRYLGSWRARIEQACQQLGFEFVINPQDLSQADVLVAFRGEEWDGDVCRQWKSGVKYVNAIAAGRPIVTQSCAAFTELAPPGISVDHPAHLTDALASLSAYERRHHAYEQGRDRARNFAVEAVANHYAGILEHVARLAV